MQDMMATCRDMACVNNDVDDSPNFNKYVRFVLWTSSLDINDVRSPLMEPLMKPRALHAVW